MVIEEYKERARMTLTKALEILKDHLHNLPEHHSSDTQNALALGIEALQRLLELRQFPVPLAWKKLNGESNFLCKT